MTRPPHASATHDFGDGAYYCRRCGASKPDAHAIGAPPCTNDAHAQHQRDAKQLGHVVARLRRQAER